MRSPLPAPGPDVQPCSVLSRRGSRQDMEVLDSLWSEISKKREELGQKAEETAQKAREKR